MSLRPLLYLAITAFVLAALLAGLAIYPKFAQEPPQQYLQYNNVRGMAIEHDKLFFTLNFDQQNDLITFINSSVLIDKSIEAESDLPFSKIVVYRFDKPDIEIVPMGYQNDSLVFTANAWHQNAPLIEKSEGKLKKLLEQTYD